MYISGAQYTLKSRIHQLATSEADIDSFVNEASSYFIRNRVSYSWKEVVEKELARKYAAFNKFPIGEIISLTTTADMISVTADADYITIG